MNLNIIPAIKRFDGTMIPIEIGKWYSASYGFDCVIGKCTSIGQNSVTLSFRWGNPFRTIQIVPLYSIIGEHEDPTLFGKLKKIFKLLEQPK